MISAIEVAHRLGGHRSGDGYLVRCPNAGHGKGQGDRNPSLLVTDGHSRLLVKCFAGCATGDILRALEDVGLTHPDLKVAVRVVPAPRNKVHDKGVAPRAWESSLPLTRTVAEIYLRRHRRLAPPFPASLRFVSHHPVCALGAAVQRPDDSVSAVQLTYLDPSGRKAAVSPVRRTVGVLGDGAVRLGIAGERLGLAEGVEDALAASQLSQLPCWASLGAGRMHRVAVPPKVRELHIFADDDGAGRAAAECTADLHRHLGRRVVLRLPPPGFKDWGEVVQQRSGEAA
jgi:putative DNA primase/helicase